MPRTRHKRRRKHRGTQAGTVERAAHNTRRGRAETATERPRTKTEARAEARRRREERMSRPPSWSRTINRAAIAAAIVAVVTILFGEATPLGGMVLGAFSLLIYIPLGYAIDRAVYRRTQRRRAAGEHAGGSSPGG